MSSCQGTGNLLIKNQSEARRAHIYKYRCGTYLSLRLAWSNLSNNVKSSATCAQADRIYSRGTITAIGAKPNCGIG